MPAHARVPKTSASDSLFNSGARFKGRHLQLYLNRDNNCKSALFCVAKKTFRNKPQRNRLRRLLKAAYQSQANTIENQGYNVALVVTSPKATFKQLKQEIVELLCKALADMPGSL